jgi:hypothetical protein
LDVGIWDFSLNHVAPFSLRRCYDRARGIDQALPYPVNPVLYEPYVRDALALRSLEQTRRAIRHADAPERRQ